MLTVKEVNFLIQQRATTLYYPIGSRLYEVLQARKKPGKSPELRLATGWLIADYSLIVQGE